MYNGKILFAITYPVFFHVIEPVLKEMLVKKIAFEVLIPRAGDDMYKVNFHNSLEEAVSSYCIPLSDIPKNEYFDIVYSDYPEIMTIIAKENKIKYRVRINYFAGGGNKPRLFYDQKIYNPYDYVLCLSTIDAEILSGHVKTLVIGNLKLADYKRARIESDTKKTVLWLPTWGVDLKVNTNINADIANALIALRKRFIVVTKMHNNTAHNPIFTEQRKIFSSFDKVYDPDIPLVKIFNEADIVLSDTSSATFDAIAANIPVALYGLGSPIIYGGKLCHTQQLLIDEIIPGTENLNEIEMVIENALQFDYFQKQQKLKAEIFPLEGKKSLDAFFKFQDDLLLDNVDEWYIATRRAIRESIASSIVARADNPQIELRQGDAIEQIESIRNMYENSTSWKITKPLRMIMSYLRRRN